MYFGDYEARAAAFKAAFPNLSPIKMAQGLHALDKSIRKFYGTDNKYLGDGSLRDAKSGE